MRYLAYMACLGLVIGSALISAPTARAQTAPHCPPGVSPSFSDGFAWLETLLGDTMGEPIECPHANPANGDVIQQTTTGLAYWRKSTNTPTFTNGWDHWAWTSSGLITWSGLPPDPPDGDQGDGAPVFDTVEVPLISIGTGSVGCGDEVVFVQRSVAPTSAPLTAALGELLSLDEQMYGQSGLYHALYQSDLSVASLSLTDGAATIHLEGQLRLGGTCDAPRVEAQLERVALQYDTVEHVQVFINGQPLDTVLSSR